MHMQEGHIRDEIQTVFTAFTIFLAHNGYNVSPQFHASNEWLKYEFEINKPISLSIRIFELRATP